METKTYSVYRLISRNIKGNKENKKDRFTEVILAVYIFLTEYWVLHDG
jgi:hypothetical protein